MGRGTIFEISKRKTGMINEENFYDIVPIMADYVEDSQNQDCLLNLLSKLGAKTGENFFILTDDVKYQYFASRLDKIKEIVSNLTLEEFASSDMYTLKYLIENDYGDLVYENENLISLDQWIREADTGVKYFVGNTVYMH